jgi:predicted amidohydrolase
VNSVEMPPSATVRVAVTQAEPVWLDMHKTVVKTCELIEEAAHNGAKLVTFPECWIPGECSIYYKALLLLVRSSKFKILPLSFFFDECVTLMIL